MLCLVTFSDLCRYEAEVDFVEIRRGIDGHYEAEVDFVELRSKIGEAKLRFVTSTSLTYRLVPMNRERDALITSIWGRNLKVAIRRKCFTLVGVWVTGVFSVSMGLKDG